MAKYNYVEMTDPANRFPKHIPQVASQTAAENAIKAHRIPYLTTQSVDDAVEFWNNTNLVGVYGITPKMLFFARTGNLNQFIPG
jgi:hypothetical protein